MFAYRHAWAHTLFTAVVVCLCFGGAAYCAFYLWPFDARMFWAAAVGLIASGIYACVAGDAIVKSYLEDAPKREPNPKPVEPRKFEQNIEMRLWLWDERYHAVVIALPAPLDKVSRWLKELYKTPGYNTSFKRWGGTGKIFGEREYRAVMYELIKRGLMRWRDPTNKLLGSELTPEGRVMLHTYALTTAPPKDIDDAIDSPIP